MTLHQGHTLLVGLRRVISQEAIIPSDLGFGAGTTSGGVSAGSTVPFGRAERTVSGLGDSKDSFLDRWHRTVSQVTTMKSTMKQVL